MIAVALVGPLWRDPNSEEDEKFNTIFIESIVKWLDVEYLRGCYVLVTIGCTKGFGKHLKEYCRTEKLGLIEVLVYFNNDIKDKYLCSKALSSRYAALIDCSDVFVISLLETKRTPMDLMVGKIKETDKPYLFYNEANSLTDVRGFPGIDIGVE